MSTVNDAPLIIDNIRPGGTRPAESPTRADQAKPKGEDEASFWDLLDVINPLQHIPVVSTIYREITGDTIKPIARLAGGALFGGIVGAGLAAASAAAEGMMGLENGESMLSFLFGGTEDEARPTVDAGTEMARQTIGAAPEGQESPAQMIARYAQPLEEMAQTAQAAASTPSAPAMAGAMMPSSAAPFMMDQPSAASAPAPEPATAFAAMRQRVETAAAPQVAPPAGVMPATAAALKGPETADRAQENQAAARAPDAVQRALEAQGLGPDAAAHPMIQALAAGKRVAPTAPVSGAPTETPQQMPGWFDQAMMQALDRYEQTGKLNGAATRSAAANI